MSKILIFGNSGSGKSTLAKRFSIKNCMAHLDLDTIAWQVTSPPIRTPISESAIQINDFITLNDSWVVEGCYSDLLQLVMEEADEIIFLNLSVKDCIKNAKNRPWEPHKYKSKEAQDANLTMLINWISRYPEREKIISLKKHM
ncbi:shikimate kinase [Paraglaciecola sp.]|uniref:shikimate kinase n=1 Tax=Paraglaciecola sp. TaxID=1920173 RepID=UPI0030F4773C